MGIPCALDGRVGWDGQVGLQSRPWDCGTVHVYHYITARSTGHPMSSHAVPRDWGESQVPNGHSLARLDNTPLQ